MGIGSRHVWKWIATVALFIGIVALHRHMFRNPYEPPVSEAAFRARIEDAGLLPIMRQLADHAFAGQVTDRNGPEYRQLRSANMTMMWHFPSEQTPSEICFVWGGGDTHFGIMISPSGPRTCPTTLVLRRWGDDIWFFWEVPP